MRRSIPMMRGLTALLALLAISCRSEPQPIRPITAGSAAHATRRRLLRSPSSPRSRSRCVPCTDHPAAGRWLWDQARLTLATTFLYKFKYDFMAWRDRADTAEDLAIVGADPAIIARVAAEAARVR